MIALAAVVLVATGSFASPKTYIFGDLLTSYSDNSQTDDNGGFSFDQTDLGVTSQLNDITDAYARISLANGTSAVTEAYVSLSGLPAEGSLTVGRFYKPLGTSVPTISLSFPALLFHGYTENGMKLNFEGYPWNAEVGLVNGNPFSVNGSTVGNSAILSNPNPGTGFDVDHRRDFYTRLGVSTGEDWGSLACGVTYTSGRLDAVEMRMLQPLGVAPPSLALFNSIDRGRRRDFWDVDLDYTYGPWHAYGEYISARDGRLSRRTWVVAGAYRWNDWEAVLSYDELDLNVDNVDFNRPYSWDRSRTTASLVWKPMEVLEIQTEYEWNRENALDPYGNEIDNDGFSLQTILYF